MDPLAKTRRLFLKRISRYGLSLALLAGARPALAKPITTLTGIRISQSAEDHTRVVFDLTGDFEHRLFTLADPYRVVIDLHDTRESQAVDISNTRTNLMNGIRSASKARSARAASSSSPTANPVIGWWSICMPPGSARRRSRPVSKSASNARSSS
jgi:hypothetical protein